MSFEFRMPDVGEGIAEAEIVRWLVQKGEMVKLDQPIVGIETDKAVVEVPSPVAGVISGQGGAAGDTLHVGEILATFETDQAAPVARDVATEPGQKQPVAIPENGREQKTTQA